VAEVTRIKLFNAQTVSPQWSEVLPRGVRTTFTLSIEPRFTRPDLRFLNDASVEPLLERLERFAADSLEWEIGVLDSLKEVEALNDVYNAVLDVDELEPVGRSARTRIGAGKTYFDNSLGLALRGHNEGVFEQFRKLLGLGRNPRFRRFSGERFPATRSYVVNRGEPVDPLGWVQLSVGG
jgi:CRISPR/Cas system CSM-associated protein Csm5 (group 7 of RAMP superfamily)